MNYEEVKNISEIIRKLSLEKNKLLQDMLNLKSENNKIITNFTKVVSNIDKTQEEIKFLEKDLDEINRNNIETATKIDNLLKLDSVKKNSKDKFKNKYNKLIQQNMIHSHSSEKFLNSEIEKSRKFLNEIIDNNNKLVNEVDRLEKHLKGLQVNYGKTRFKTKSQLRRSNSCMTYIANSIESKNNSIYLIGNKSFI